MTDAQFFQVVIALPVTETGIVSGGTKGTTTLSMWGEQVVIDIPPLTDTIPSSKIMSRPFTRLLAPSTVLALAAHDSRVNTATSNRTTIEVRFP
jgi:hypothetical protein